MASLNTNARDSILTSFGIDYTTSTLKILETATELASHTLAGFEVAASGSMAASTIAPATISETGTANTATLESQSGGIVTLTVGLSGSGADLILSTLTFISGQTSTISGLTITKAP